VRTENLQLTMNLRSLVNVNLSTASIRSKGSSESLILYSDGECVVEASDKGFGAHAANKSGLSR
jgi:hypothetical protein